MRAERFRWGRVFGAVLLAALLVMLAVRIVPPSWLSVVPGLTQLVYPDTRDRIRHLDTTYTVRPDGTVHVSQRIDYTFGELGRRGITYAIMTRDVWEPDPDQEVTYGVSNITVSSPSGAPSDVVEDDPDAVDGEVNLRIGDPDRRLWSRQHTYVISYDLTGALRTHADGVPELYWDVTATGTPEIDSFTVRVEAPGDVGDARCFVGTRTCEASANGHSATYSGGRVPVMDVLSVVATVDPATVSVPEPLLERRVVDTPTLVGLDSAMTLGADGVLDVRQEMQYILPLDVDRVRLGWKVPRRRPVSATQDVVTEVGEPQATVDGVSVRVEGAASGADSGGQGASWQDASWHVELPRQSTDDPVRRTVVLTYRARGAVVDEGGLPMLRWPLAGTTLRNVSSGAVALRLPTAPTVAGCRDVSAYGDTACAAVSVTGAGAEIRYELGPASWFLDDRTAVVTLPSGAVAPATDLLAPSIDHTTEVRRLGTRWGTWAALVLGLAAGVGFGRLRAAPDQRFAGTAPGIVDDPAAPTVAASGRRTVPVRFTPPDGLSPAEADALLHRRYRPAQLAAVLAGLASAGAARVSTHPLSVIRVPDTRVTDPLDREVLEQAYADGTPMNTPLTRARLSAMIERTEARSRATLSSPRLAVRRKELADDLERLGGRRLVGWGVAGLVIVAAGMVFMPVLKAGSLWILGVGLGALGLSAWIATPKRAPVVLTATGTALREQTLGFRTYLATAEADQLNDEADADRFSRYLPWAVVFGLTERWLRVCRDLAAAGRLTVPGAAGWMTGESGGLGRSAVELRRSVWRADVRHRTISAWASPGGGGGSGGGRGGGGSSGGSSSRGSSGGSSGRSSGASGGSGGGGTRIGSW